MALKRSVNSCDFSFDIRWMIIINILTMHIIKKSNGLCTKQPQKVIVNILLDCLKMLLQCASWPLLICLMPCVLQDKVQISLLYILPYHLVPMYLAKVSFTLYGMEWNFIHSSFNLYLPSFLFSHKYWAPLLGQAVCWPLRITELKKKHSDSNILILKLSF